MRSNTVRVVISGGQTGADIAALRAAKRLGITTGGVAPPGFMTNRGKNMDLLHVYNLVEYSGAKTGAAAYVERSRRNVDASNATVAFRLGPSVGTDKTIGYATTGRWQNPSIKFDDRCIIPETKYRPVFIVTSLANPPRTAEFIRNFIEKNRVSVLNVCGHRAWQTPAGSSNFEAMVQDIVFCALSPPPTVAE